jgi:hypothetical protein
MKTTLKKTEKRTARWACLTCAAALAAMVSCVSTGTQPTSFDKDPIVVQAYLYAGRPVNDVRLLHLTKSIRDTLVKVYSYQSGVLDSSDTIISLVKDSTFDNASVTISNNGISSALTFRDSGWYQDMNGSLVVAIGQTYRIDIVAEGRHAWAQTTVPAPVGGLTVSRDSLYTLQNGTIIIKDKILGKDKPPIDTFGKPLPQDMLPDSLTHLIVKWNNSGRAYLYYRCIQDTNLPYTMRSGDYTIADSMKIVSSYSGFLPSDSVMPVISLMQPGRYKIFLFTTTPDYRSMVATEVDTMHQDLWNGSPNNIHDGLGFFTSFSSDSASFTIIGKEGSGVGGGSSGGGGKRAK